MGHPGKPHPDALHVRLERAVPVEPSLLLYGRPVGLRPQGDLLLLREGDEGEFGFSRNGVDGAGVHREGQRGERGQGKGDPPQRSMDHPAPPETENVRYSGFPPLFHGELPPGNRGKARWTIPSPLI